MSAPRRGKRIVWSWAAFMMFAVLAAAAGAIAWGWPGLWAGLFPRSSALRAAQAAYDREDWPAAARLARQALKHGPDDVEGLRLLARASVREGRDASAMALFQRLGPSAMNAEDLHLLGLALVRSGKAGSARDVWKQAVAQAPDHVEALFELTLAYYKNDQLAEAEKTGKALAGHPGWKARAEALLGQIRLARDDPAGAAELWRSASRRPPEGPFVNQQGPMVPPKALARAWLRAGRPEEARAALRPLLKSPAAKGAATGTSGEPENGPGPETYWLLGRVELQQGRYAEARSALQKGSEYRDEAPDLPDPAPYVGSARCAKCHASEFRDQRASRHARTFFRAHELAGLKLPSGSVPDPALPRVVHTLVRTTDARETGAEVTAAPRDMATTSKPAVDTGPDKVEASGVWIRQNTRVGDDVFSAVVEYAFGSGDRGLTLVGRDEAGGARELRLSSYPDGTATHWDVTAGHPRRPERPKDYLGEPLTEDQVRRCMACHLTTVHEVLSSSGPCAMDRGIGCEKCHGPGGNHIRAVEADLVAVDPAIGQPSQVSGMRLVRVCAQCHSPKGLTVRRDDPASIRFQGTTLTWSRCFTESDDALDCTTCHNPHRDATPSVAYYEARCLSCHAPGGAKARAARTACPVNPSNGCIGCHMPSVKGIVPHSAFTDHFIRVHR